MILQHPYFVFDENNVQSKSLGLFDSLTWRSEVEELGLVLQANERFINERFKMTHQVIYCSKSLDAVVVLIRQGQSASI